MSAALELSPETGLVVAGVSLPVPKIIGADKDNLLGKLADEIAGFKADISTPRGRKEIASLAYKVSTTKADLIRLGKGMTEEWRKSTKAVNEECSVIEERMDALRDRVRAPLTEFENREKARIKGHEDALADIAALAIFQSEPASEEIAERLRTLDVAEIERDWQEFAQRAHDLHAEVGFKLTEALKAALAREAEAAAAERRRLKAEEAAHQEAERARREREARIAAEAAERARKEAATRAAEDAARERQRVEQERQDAEDRAREAEIAAQAEIEAIEAAARIAAAEAEERRLAALRQAQEAEERAARAEQQRVEAERRAEAARVAAEQKAEWDRIAAVEAERARAAAQKAAEERAAEERARNMEIKRKVNFDAAAALVVHAGITEQQAQRVIVAIAKGHVPSTRISY